ncbi:MAG: metallopeptidase family protein [Thermoanaerobacterales bacterium]|nr:metallopeptidase family protein [Bacillota bacterium]MDI6905997.1 metallopeptidase family protein [Thermoanaerobacterales bacterium]
MAEKTTKPAYSLDEFTELAGRLVDMVPARFCRDLNGGFLILPEARPDEEFYIMGEYVEDPVMGSYIVLHYGSFVAVLEDETREVWEDELWETILHELQHHLETMAGVDDLARAELAELARWREEQERQG